MGMKELEQAFALIEDNAEEALVEGGKPEDLIRAAENLLKLRFPPTYRTFLSRMGGVDVAGEEFYGLNRKNLENPSIPDAVGLTLEERTTSRMPESMLIIHTTTTGVHHTLDTSRAGEDEECPVVAWDPGYSNPGDVLEVIAPDFGTCLLETISMALE